MWLYNTGLNIFTTCGKSFMHRLLCGFEESCHQLRQCFIKGKKRDIPLPSQLTALMTPPPAPNPSQQQWCFLQNQGEGRKIPLMKIPQSPSTQPPTSLCMLNKAGKNYLGSPCMLSFGSGRCSHQLCSYRFFCHLLRLRWINLHFCTCSCLWGERGLWKEDE